MTVKKFISLCKSFHQTYTTTNLSMGSLVIEDSDSEDENEWNPKNSISPACLQFICKKYKISHYVYDTTHQCFFKNVGDCNYPALCYYVIGNQYLIRC